MVLGDTNFWIALSLSQHYFHRLARNWFDRQSAEHSVLFCRATQQSFMRLITTEAVLRPYDVAPMNNTAAWNFYHEIAADPRVGFAREPKGIEKRWKYYSEHRSASPKLWMDAYLAALAMAGGHRLVTTDEGFRQFKGLDLIILPETKIAR